MQILLCHTYYQIRGGEDAFFESTCDLLRRQGHTVTEYVRHNDEINRYGVLDRLSLGLRTSWAWDSHAAVSKLLRETKPDIVQFSNTFPLISPAAYHACQQAGVPVIQSLENARLMCPGGMFYRDGLCHDCLGKKVPWKSVVYGCYHRSRWQTAAVAAMLSLHWLEGTWTKAVDAYLVTTRFWRELYAKGGLPESKLRLRHQFIDPDPGLRTGGPGDYALYMGRLAPEKGVKTLLQAWEQLPEVPLKIRGEGPLAGEVAEFAARHPNVELVPRLTREEKFKLIKGARFVVWPSTAYYETFGMVPAEAFACGVPVIASRTGVAPEMVTEGYTGVFFTSEDHADLITKVQYAWLNGDEMLRYGLNARSEYETRFTARTAYACLASIYSEVLATRGRKWQEVQCEAAAATAAPRNG